MSQHGRIPNLNDLKRARRGRPKLVGEGISEASRCGSPICRRSRANRRLLISDRTGKCQPTSAPRIPLRRRLVISISTRRRWRRLPQVSDYFASALPSNSRAWTPSADAIRRNRRRGDHVRQRRSGGHWQGGLLRRAPSACPQHPRDRRVGAHSSPERVGRCSMLGHIGAHTT